MNKIKNLLLVATFLLLIVGASFLGYSLSYKNLILPNIFVSGVDIGGLTTSIAEEKIKSEFLSNQNEIVFVDSKGGVIGKLQDVEIRRDYKWVVDQAIKIGRTGNFLVDIRDRAELVYKHKSLKLPVIVDEDQFDNFLDNLSLKVQIDPVWPKIVKKNKKFELKKGSNGQTLNKEKIKQEIREKLVYTGKQQVSVLVDTVKTEENKELVDRALNILNSWGDQVLLVQYKEYNKKLEADEVAPLFGLTSGALDIDSFSDLVLEISETVETEPKDAIFEFEEGRVKEFKAEVVGVTVDKPKFKSLLENTLVENTKKTIEVPVILNYPEIVAGDINTMGIKELLGVGKSSFGHSIPNRVFNVNLASSRINGVVVAPGEEFSFVKAVGDINRQTGYQTAYVISGGKTVLGDGGGVCQVSTTVFRAAMNSGFPITERHAHAYRVGYYEQDSSPGIDATIYAPTVDLKFLNDTGHHILVQTKVDTKNMTMSVEIYGTSDGRVSTVSKPVITSQTSALPTSYVDDPNLPKGTTKQIDWSAPGAKVNFDYKVERGGETLFEKRFASNYQPWRAIYLVGTGQ